jgi:geranylgeranyl reductase family protein
MSRDSLSPEILVIGAGPGGSAAAWALASQGHDVLLIDQADFPRDKTCGDGLTPMALGNLDSMGVLDAIEAAQPTRVDALRLVGPFGQSITMPVAALETEYPYALIVPRYTLDNILREHAVKAGALFSGKTRVEHIQRDGDQVTAVECRGEDGTVIIKPRRVVFAVGANMGLLAREGFIPPKSTIVRAARGYYSNVHIPVNRFDFYIDLELMPGYGWIFPMGDGDANIGVGTMPGLWASKRPTATLLKEFIGRRAKEGVTRDSELTGSVKGFPLRIDFPAHRVEGKNWLIVGEATGLVNPITGEGIDLALESALLAADIIHSGYEPIAYQRELWERFGPLYDGLRALRNIIVTPFFADYAFWLMSQHDFLGRLTLKISQGLQPPQDVFHPLFILQFFSPISPRWAARELGKLMRGYNPTRAAR